MPSEDDDRGAGCHGSETSAPPEATEERGWCDVRPTSSGDPTNKRLKLAPAHPQPSSTTVIANTQHAAVPYSCHENTDRMTTPLAAVHRTVESRAFPHAELPMLVKHDDDDNREYVHKKPSAGVTADAAALRIVLPEDTVVEDSRLNVPVAKSVLTIDCGDDQTSTPTQIDSKLATSKPSFLKCVGFKNADDMKLSPENQTSMEGFPDQSDDDNPSLNSKKNQRFSPEEDRVIEQGVQLFGLDWQKIIQWGNLNRTPKQIKSRYDRILLHTAKKNLSKVADISTTAPSPKLLASKPVSVPATNNTPLITNYLHPCPSVDTTPHKNSKPKSNQSTPKRNVKMSPPPSRTRPSSPALRRIDEYFVRKTPQTLKPTGDGYSETAIIPESLLTEQERLKGRIVALENDFKNEHERVLSLLDENNQLLNMYEQHSTEWQSRLDERNQKTRTILVDLLRRDAVFHGRAEREEVMRESLRLGQYHQDRQGRTFRESVSEGWAFTDLREKQQRLSNDKDELEKLRKVLLKRKHNSKGSVNAEDVDDNGFVQPRPISPDVHEEEEILKLKINAVKKDENELQVALEKLYQERDSHIRRLRRIQDEDQSRFHGHPILNDRYLLLKLIGRGGFSEVYKAFDLQELRNVACKIHSLNNHWSNDKKANYIKHAVREFRIHRALNHPRIVQFYDIFEIDENSFCTVLEYCDGPDLDQYLRTTSNKLLSEREARTIILQIFSGLRYLNQINPPVIHYDLKPGNILMTDGGIKITDFGLSKIYELDESRTMDSEGMELTSQGAGTYWYLPPECFVRGLEPPKISSKVDVWSAGVIFYQMLYGVKPFGQNQSQQTILQESTIIKAHNVSFPAKPNVSPEAKDFIRRCLEYRKEVRPDVLTVCEDPYLKPYKKQSFNQ